MKRARRLFINFLGILFVIFLTILLGRGFQARGLPDLKPWHRADLGDVKAGRAGETATSPTTSAGRTPLTRRSARRSCGRSGGGPHGGEPVPAGRLRSTRRASAPRTGTGPSSSFRRVRGGALLLHGLTDAPYSVRPTRGGAAEGGLRHARAAPAGPRHGALGPVGDVGRLDERRPTLPRATSARRRARARRSSSSATRTAARSP